MRHTAEGFGGKNLWRDKTAAIGYGGKRHVLVFPPPVRLLLSIKFGEIYF
jgi:hypothetical protein